jgi:hypothetical protein
MNIRFLAAAIACFGLSQIHAQAAEKTDMPDLATIANPKAWKVTHATAESVEVNGKRAVRLLAEGDSANGIVGLALPAGLNFTTGTIEIDLKGRNLKQRSFLGVAFNVVDERTFEAVYFRPFNFKAEDPFRHRAVQYISWPTNTWEYLRKNTPGKYENRIEPVPDPDDWFHARIEITEREVRVFANGAKVPSLIVERLSKGNAMRPAGLFVDSAEGLYANFKVTQGE